MLFLIWPEVDLDVAAWFYRPEDRFYLAETGWVQFSYRVFAELHWVILPLLFALLLFAGLRRKEWRAPAFLLLLLVLGPGLLVNAVLKSESGRARPHQTEIFGGERPYTAPFQPAQNCDRNCSFVSGHAALGFWFIGLAWVFARRPWLWLGIGIGALVGLGRMIQGAHFLSDVIFSFWVVYFTALLLSRWLYGRSRPWEAADPTPLATGSHPAGTGAG